MKSSDVQSEDRCIHSTSSRRSGKARTGGMNLSWYFAVVCTTATSLLHFQQSNHGKGLPLTHHKVDYLCEDAGFLSQTNAKPYTANRSLVQCN